MYESRSDVSEKMSQASQLIEVNDITIIHLGFHSKSWWRQRWIWRTISSGHCHRNEGCVYHYAASLSLNIDPRSVWHWIQTQTSVCPVL